ncbi:MAG: radical SAM protein, partial [bacterium]
MAQKEKVLLCKILGVEGDFGLKYDPKFLSLALFYLKEYACLDEDVRKNYEFQIKIYPLYKTDEEIIEEIWSLSPQLIAFSAYLPEIEKTLSVSRKIKYILPDSTIIIGGPSVGDSQGFIKMHPYVDIIVRAEGEESFHELLLSRLNGDGLEKVKGITFKCDGEIVKNPDRPLDFDVNNIPIIFTDEFMEGTSGLATCETTRGCRHRCRFCGIGKSGTRNYSMERIEFDLKQILSNKAIRRIFIGDSDFFADRDRAVQILEILKKHNRYKTQLEFYSDFLGPDEELLKECRSAYIHDSLRIPIQTISKDAIREAHRLWFDFDHVRESVPTVLKYFPSTSAELIYGLPNDNYEGMKNSIKWCVEGGLINIKLHRLQNLPGSAYTRHSEMYGLKADEKSPHLVYYSNTFTYDESLHIEALSRNLQGIFFFIYPTDYPIFSAFGIDVFNIAEDIHLKMERWDGSLRRASEANLSEASQETADVLLDYLEQYNGLNPEKRAFLQDLFRCRYVANSIYRHLRDYVLYNADIDTAPSDGKCPLIPRYDSVEITHNIADKMEPENLAQYMKRKQQKIYLLYSYPANSVLPVRVRNPEFFNRILNLFNGSVPSVEDIIRRVSSEDPS